MKIKHSTFYVPPYTSYYINAMWFINTGNSTFGNSR